MNMNELLQISLAQQRAKVAPIDRPPILSACVRYHWLGELIAHLAARPHLAGAR